MTITQAIVQLLGLLTRLAMIVFWVSLPIGAISVLGGVGYWLAGVWFLVTLVGITWIAGNSDPY